MIPPEEKINERFESRAQGDMRRTHHLEEVRTRHKFVESRVENKELLVDCIKLTWKLGHIESSTSYRSVLLGVLLSPPRLHARSPSKTLLIEY